jgi:DNA-binding NarL/FixJ family response regulator
MGNQASMVAIAILTTDPLLRSNLKLLPREDAALTLAGIGDSPSALIELAERRRVDIVLADARLGGQFASWRIRSDRTALVVILDHADGGSELDALTAGASAVLPRTANRKEIVAAINAVASGFIVIQRKHLHEIVSAELPLDKFIPGDGAHAQLTPRELEVLTAMADGLSNKAIARRLSISFHTAKFHVAAILEKLGADTRTEAVIKATQYGLVML